MTSSISRDNKKIVVTGAAGFIGSHLSNHLITKIGGQVIGIDNLRSGSWSRCDAAVDRIEADLNDITLSDWESILSDTDIVFHLAAEKYNSSRSTPSKLLNTNILATERLFRAAASQGVKRVVFTSSLYAYGSLGPETMVESDVPRPITLYGMSKLAGEHMLSAIDREIGLSWNVARLFFIYGPKQFAEGGYKSVINKNFERLLAGHDPQIYGDGKQELDYVFVDDCVFALVQMATSTLDRTVANISSGVGTSISELTAKMSAAARSKSAPTNQPPDWTAGSRRVGANHVAFESFGWAPSVSLEDGLTATYDWMKANEHVWK